MKEREHKRMLKRMKFISDQEGIMTRYLREKENWSPHIQQCKEFISGSFKDLSLKSVAVLGSGWLLDLPLEHLSARFEEVLLVDIHHPPQVRKKIEAFDNVKIQEADITGGGIAFAWKIANSQSGGIDRSLLHFFDPLLPSLSIEADAIISLNILNQLDILITDYLKEADSNLKEDDFRVLRRTIQQFHIQWITQKPGCLISDIAEFNYGQHGKMTQLDLLHTDLPDSKRSEQWTWDFDLSGFYHRDHSTKMQVQALEW